MISIKRTIYHPHINNPDKLKQFKTNEKTRKFRPGNNYIEFLGNNLDIIFRTLSFYVKDLIVDNDIKDSLYYKFTIPSAKKNGVIKFLDNEMDITFTEETKPVEVITFTFE